jgi:hypothetical protein
MAPCAESREFGIVGPVDLLADYQYTPGNPAEKFLDVSA